MDVVPWHIETSYLASGWQAPSPEKAQLLPDLRRLRAGTPRRAEEAVRHKAARPSLAEVACSQGAADHDRAAEVQRRLAPAPPCDWRRSRQHQICLALAAAKKVGPRRIGPRDGAENPFFEDAFVDEVRLLEVVSCAGAGLERLRLADHHWLSAELIERLPPLVPALRELSLRGTLATDAAVAAFCSACPELRVLDVSECELTDLTPLAGLPELRDFRAARCAAATPAAVAALRGATRLEVLDLSFCPDIDSECLVALAGGCHQLLRLELPGCPLVGDDALVALCISNPSIQHLSIALNVEHLSDSEVAKALKGLRRLHFFDMCGCIQLGRQVGTCIARNCECVEILNFASCNVTDRQVQNILARCLSLRRLDLSMCAHLTDEAFHNSLAIPRHLEKLTLTHVPGISEEALNQLRQQLPECKVEREARRFVDPNSLVLVLGEPPKAKEKARPKEKSKVVKKEKAAPAKTAR